MKMSSFFPREHGTWAMWVVPMLSALLATHFSMSFLILFLCFALLFISHGPIVALAKKQMSSQDDEVIAATVMLAAALLFGIALIMVYRLPWLLVFGGVELGLFAFSVRTFVEKEQRTFFNELTIVAALTLLAPASYYVITGLLDEKALILYAINFFFFGSSIFYVKMRIEFLRMKGRWEGDARKARLVTIVYHLLLVAFIVVASLSSTVSVLVFAGFVPMLVQVLSAAFSHGRQLDGRNGGKQSKVNFTRLGVILVVQSVVFLLFVGIFWR